MPSPRPGLQEQLESSAWGRALISLVLLFTMGAVLVTNLPDSYIKRRVSDISQPYINAVGLDQGWGVFSPNPRRQVIGLEGRVVFEDGTTRIWRPPDRSPLFGGLSDHRWRKYREHTILDARQDLWRPLALYVLRQAAGDDRRRPVSVQLVRSFYDIEPPGPGPSRTPEEEFRYFTLPVTPQVLREAGRA